MSPNEVTHDIFISYRREGGFEMARYLYDNLVRDGYRVTFDLDSLRSGRFDEALLGRIDECTDFVIVLNKGCFDRTLDPKFPRETDWMRRELGYAIGKGKNVIPILLGGYLPPRRLPTDIDAVRFMNGPEYSMEYIDSFYGKLKRFLRTPAPADGRKADPGKSATAADAAICEKCHRWMDLTKMFSCPRCGKNYCLEHQDPETYLCKDCAQAQGGANGGVRTPPGHNWLLVGRNDPCPCGSGKKYKNCCAQRLDYTVQDGETVDALARLFEVGGDALRRLNGFRDGEEVAPGQLIKIP